MAFADDVKEYCGTDDNVSGFIAAAEAYMANAGIPAAESNPLYALAVKMLVSYWYDNRVPCDAAASGNAKPYGFGGIILQLQLGAS